MIDFCMIVLEDSYLFNPWTIEPLGALYICGAAAECVSTVRIVQQGQEPIPDAHWYGISIVTPHYEQARSTIATLRSQHPSSKIILGGAHCTFLPFATFCDLHPDFLVAGEGELAIQSILDNTWQGWSGIYTTLGGYGLAPLPDFASLPIPDHTLLAHVYYPNPAFSTERGGAIMASRGCPYNCSYCGKSIGRAPRWRDPSQVAEEMQLYTQWRFEDDDMFGNLDWLREFATIVPSGREWRCSVRADSITPEVLDLARRAGCRQIGIGVETASPRLLAIHCKSKSVERNTQALLMAKDAGFLTTAFLIAGLPGETEETLQETIDWIKTVKPDKFTVSACTPYPGSPLWNNPERYGMLNLDTNFSNFKQLGKEELDEAFVYDTQWADRRQLTAMWKRLREAASYGIAAKV